MLVDSAHKPNKNILFLLPISTLQPSQLYISQKKLHHVQEQFQPKDKSNFEPIPIKEFDGRLLMTDGHTRAVAVCIAGWEEVPACMDTDELDMCAYAMAVKWCDDEGIKSPFDLMNRIISHRDYERLWLKRCLMMFGEDG